jgi:hypothetical protein
VALGADEVDRWQSRIDAALAALDASRAASVLPDEPPNAAELDAWLVGVRRARL